MSRIDRPLRTALLALGIALSPGRTALPQAPIRHVDLTSITGKLWHSMAYDEARERILMFGGGETWEWNGATWHQRFPAASPPVLANAAMAYDAARRRIVLFGGTRDDPSGHPQDGTWEWDGVSWVERLPVTRPPATAGRAIAHDASRSRVVLQSGAETWEWDGSDWQRRGQGPAGVVAMSYDSSRQVVRAYAGHAGGGDTWEWDGATWIQVATGGPGVNGRVVEMVHDLRAGRSLLIGNFCTSSACGFSAWEWSGAGWTQPPSARIDDRRDVAAAYDAARGETVAFGGWDTWHAGSPPPMDPVETWAWDGSRWDLRHTGDGHEGSARSLVLDSTRNELVSLGSYYDGNNVSREFWRTRTRTWDGARWTQHDTPFVNLGGMALAHDPVRQVTVLFGGSGPDGTWEWDGSAWRARTPLVSPGARVDHAMAFDAASSSTLLFGGFTYLWSTAVYFDDTWSWNGVSWTRLAPSHAPSPRRGHALVHDPVRRRTILHGGDPGGAPLSDTWEWDGTDWQRVAAGPAASDHAMAWDPTRQRIVLYVGDQLYEYFPGAWARVATSGPLPVANGGAMSYHPARRALVVTGGRVTRLLGEVAEASTADAGTGCAGSYGVPRLACEIPRLGAGSIELTMNDAPPVAVVAFGLSLTQRSLALGGGCSFFLDTPIAWAGATSSGHGHAETRLPMPLDLTLRGLELWSQGAALDPAAAHGFALTQAVRLRIGD